MIMDNKKAKFKAVVILEGTFHLVDGLVDNNDTKNLEALAEILSGFAKKMHLEEESKSDPNIFRNPN